MDTKTLFILLFHFAIFSQTDTSSAPIDTITYIPVIVNHPQHPTGITFSDIVDGSDRIVIITAGTGTIKFY